MPAFGEPCKGVLWVCWWVCSGGDKAYAWGVLTGVIGWAAFISPQPGASVWCDELLGIGHLVQFRGVCGAAAADGGPLCVSGCSTWAVARCALSITQAVTGGSGALRAVMAPGGGGGCRQGGNAARHNDAA
jgi:hypothetical protein